MCLCVRSIECKSIPYLAMLVVLALLFMHACRTDAVKIITVARGKEDELPTQRQSLLPSSFFEDSDDNTHVSFLLAPV